MDCTGDGDVAARAGAPWQDRHAEYGVGKPFGMSNLDVVKAAEFLRSKGMLTQVARAAKETPDDPCVRRGFDLKKLELFKAFTEPRKMWRPLAVSYHVNEINIINSAAAWNVDPTKPEDMTRAEIELREQVVGLAEFLRKHIPGFENSHLSWTPVQQGVRRTRIIECEHDITLDEIVVGARFDDEVALYGFHDSAPRIMIKDAKVYGIPYRALPPKKMDNLLVAGRMITTGFEAHMSTRNTVSCMAQRQAAGTAVALAARAGVSPRKLDVREPRRTLAAAGVYLGDGVTA